MKFLRLLRAILPRGPLATILEPRIALRNVPEGPPAAKHISMAVAASPLVEEYSWPSGAELQPSNASFNIYLQVGDSMLCYQKIQKLCNEFQWFSLSEVKNCHMMCVVIQSHLFWSSLRQSGAVMHWLWTLSIAIPLATGHGGDWRS